MATRWSVRWIIKRMLPILCALTIIEIGSGLVLDTIESALYHYPSLLVLVPVMIGTAGNIGSILASRLSTAVHLGLLEFSPGNDLLTGNALATVALSVTVFPLVGAGAWLLSELTADASLGAGTVILISLLSGIVLSLSAVIVSVSMTYIAYLYQLDPDDVVVPVVTTICDVLGVVVLFGVIRIVI
jgi:mgtE-like transporter